MKRFLISFLIFGLACVSHAELRVSGEVPGVTGGAGTGDVVGPSSSTSGNFPVYSGTTGKVIANSTYGPGNYGNLGTPTGDLSNCTNAQGTDGSYGPGWNSDPSAAEKDDIYDYLHLFDTDDDGDYTDESWYVSATANWDTIGDPSVNGDINFTTTIQTVTLGTAGALRIGNGANYFEVANDGGVVTVRLGGTAISQFGTYTVADEGAAIQTSAGADDWGTIDQAHNGSGYVSMHRNYNGTNPYKEIGPPTNNLRVDSTGAMTFQGTAALTNLKCQTFPVEIGLALSDESTDLTTGTAKVTIRAPYAFTLTGVRASVNTAPVGSTIAIDINESGASVLSTVLTIDAGEKTSTTAAVAAVISDSAIADDGELTFDLDQVGATTAGKGAKIWLLGYRDI